MKRLLLVPLVWLAAAGALSQENAPPVRLAIIGLAHDHVRGFLPLLHGRTDVELVGIVESNPELVAQIAERFHLEAKLFFPSLEALCAKAKPQAVATFTSTFDHRRVVEECAPRGIHVMMEKPLAVSLDDARAMAAAARKGGIQLIVNYETTWYQSTHGAYDLVQRQHAIGDVRKIVVRDGHSGPAKICSPWFLSWLTDPVLDGGGAVMDFGCYGADLATWLMEGQRPTSVSAVLQHFQPETYPKVDDEATIVLTYPRAQAIIEASWNWPHGRKDMEVYGQDGSLRLPDGKTLFVHGMDGPERRVDLPALPLPATDSISWLAAIVRGQAKSDGLGSLEMNLVVNEILDAAKESARTGLRIDLPEKPTW
jgi:predicted dehydrogenase